jgi:hypothetical protein
MQVFFEIFCQFMGTKIDHFNFLICLHQVICFALWLSGACSGSIHSEQQFSLAKHFLAAAQRVWSWLC